MEMFIAARSLCRLKLNEPLRNARTSGQGKQISRRRRLQHETLITQRDVWPKKFIFRARRGGIMIDYATFRAEGTQRT